MQLKAGERCSRRPHPLITKIHWPWSYFYILFSSKILYIKSWIQDSNIAIDRIGFARWTRMNTPYCTRFFTSINICYHSFNSRVMKLKLNRLDNIYTCTFVLRLLATGPAFKTRDRSVNDLFLRWRHNALRIDSRLDVSNRIHRDIRKAQRRVVVFMMWAVGERSATTVGWAVVVTVVED